MARPKKQANGTAANIGYEAELWQMADALRGSMDAAEYKHVALGLLFLKYISDAFEEKHAQLESERSQGADPEDPDEYRALNIFWVPPEARWSHLKAQAKQPTIGQLVDDAMAGIERDNPALKGVLPKEYARPALDKQRLGQLIDLISNIRVGDAESRAKDVLGRVYEYFLSQFASAEGKKGGEFYTPRCVVRLLVEMIEPYKGRVYDPCCGSSGMFVQSVEFIRAHANGNGNSGNAKADISIYGQESNYTTWRLAKMNLAIRGIDGQIAHGDTFHNDRFPDLKADFILANPPFNISDWGGDRLRDDKRWQYGVPPTGNANFAWVQHMIYHLAPKGVAGFILGNISLTSETGGEDTIRKGIVDANLVDCIVTLPDRLFYSTPIPAGIWILRRGRDFDREVNKPNREILFIDASRLGKSVTRTHRELTDDDLERIACTYRNWQKCSDAYLDVEGFCRRVELEEVIANGYNLLPAAYVNQGHLRATGGPQLHDVIHSNFRNETSQSLDRVTDLNKAFEESLKMAEAELRILEQEIEFKSMFLGDILIRSDERLGNAEEPEVLTCTESGGLIFQRERFAKRVATEDASDYKIVRMGDIVYNPYLLWKGSIDQCWIAEIGITSPAYEVLRVRPEFDATIVGQLVTSPEMIRRYDGISFGTVQRRRRAPVEKFLELEVNVPVGASLSAISALLDCAQDSQFACRSAERAIKSFVKRICEKLR
ncbi:type I restriction-modification system subunit M [Geobacter sulfurreducens]|uniref:type I restriction-modification system subunit M n=1 Tax=Geobacter sulfurreducens TaxID=35554 RepID=UPI0001D8F57F|nr:class I SAM-dependent DNA methyltransferase [Geobacter sulfurreducens]ADI83314.1 type I restriction-modification system DNA adenine N6-methyltransferase [Geobacter sulfurreducens KN400]